MLANSLKTPQITVLMLTISVRASQKINEGLRLSCTGSTTAHWRDKQETGGSLFQGNILFQ